MEFNQNFLKTLTILYAEDDEKARDALSKILEKVVKTVHIANDGSEAIKLYAEHQDTIDVIISDIRMPEVSGLEFLEYIRQTNKEIPFVFTTAHQENDFLLKALQFGVTHYAKKPVNVKEILLKIQEVCHTKYQYSKTLHAQKEASSYLNVLNEIAIISKTDLEGKITYINDTFCSITEFEKNEIIGNTHKIITHPDTSKEVHQKIWTSLLNSEKWSGKLKNKTKAEESYFVNAYIFPIFDEFTNSPTEYMSIQFLTTDLENEKREFKAYIRQLTIEHNTIVSQLRNEITQLEHRSENPRYIEMLEESANKSSKQNKQLLKQNEYYEDTIKKLEQEKLEIQQNAKEHFFNIKDEHKTLNHKYNSLEKAFKDLEFTSKKQIETIETLKEHLKDSEQKVRNLKDVIAHREEQIENLKSKI